MDEITLFQGDNIEVMQSQTFLETIKGKSCCIVTDPPFNVGYHYNEYKDKRDEKDYYEWLASIFDLYGFPFVVIHYPEALYKLAFQVGLFPEKVCSWVYNANTPRQHRDIAYFGVKPDFSKVKQPYKNPTDKRIAERIANGIEGGGSLRLVGNPASKKRIARQDQPPVPNAPRGHEKRCGGSS